MDSLGGTRAARFALVTAAHHFLVTALPLSDTRSRDALSEFVQHIDRSELPAVEIDAVLLRCLSKLDRCIGPGSGLIECYLALRSDVPESARFQQCVENLLRYRGIDHPLIRQTIAIIEERSHDAKLRQRSVAAALGLKPPALAAKFKISTGLTFSEYLRNVRLERAAALLCSSTKSIKEVWAQVGYNHPSNFDHDFKRRFHVTPRAYRARAVGTVMNIHAVDDRGTERDPQAAAGTNGRTVLIIDDDEGTRETIGRYLTLEGYKTVVAATGRQGLREAALVAPEVILLDYHLPDMDGLTCLRELRRESASRKPDVVLFTADWEVEVERGELDALGATLAFKLCDLEELQRLLAEK